jgi:putative endonuclease
MQVYRGFESHSLRMYFVYILYSKKLNKLYKGSCGDIRKRIKCHNDKKVKSTKNGVPWKLAHCQIFSNKKDAIAEERFLKTGKGRERIKYLLKNYLEIKNKSGEVPERSKGAPC